jgi:hypothetical protein
VPPVHDYVISNGTGAAVRSDLNGALAAIVSNNSSASEPSPTYAYMWWADTTTGLLKQRNSANSAWITIGTLASTNLGLLSLAGGTLTGALLADDSGTVALPAIAFDSDTNTGIFRAGADQFNIATAASSALSLATRRWCSTMTALMLTSALKVTPTQTCSRLMPVLIRCRSPTSTAASLQAPGTASSMVMRIDQRNAGASGTANGYTVDRFAYFGSQASKGTWQQNAGAITPPVGFKNYLGFTSSSAYTVISTDEFELYQSIEGFNVADLEWGTANAKTVILSFWVRSSLTGTFGGAFQNSNGTRSYPYSYTISAAWRQLQGHKSYLSLD